MKPSSARATSGSGARAGGTPSPSARRRARGGAGGGQVASPRPPSASSRRRPGSSSREARAASDAAAADGRAVRGRAVVLLALPAAVTFALSLTEYDLSLRPTFAGLQNFTELLDDPAFATRSCHPRVPRARGAAASGRRARRSRCSCTAVPRRRGAPARRVYLPTVVPDVAFALLWLFLANPLYGPIAIAARRRRPARRPNWLTDLDRALVLVVADAAFAIGEGFVIALAVRRELPEELYELARVEGASRGLRLPPRHAAADGADARAARLPRRRASACSSRSCRRCWSPAAGPDRATTFLPLLIYRNAFENGRYGYAAAITVVALALTLVM